MAVCIVGYSDPTYSEDGLDDDDSVDGNLEFFWDDKREEILRPPRMVEGNDDTSTEGSEGDMQDRLVAIMDARDVEDAGYTSGSDYDDYDSDELDRRFPRDHVPMHILFEASRNSSETPGEWIINPDQNMYEKALAAAQQQLANATLTDPWF
jgi:hypothetical protein